MKKHGTSKQGGALCRIFERELVLESVLGPEPKGVRIDDWHLCDKQPSVATGKGGNGGITIFSLWVFLVLGTTAGSVVGRKIEGKDGV